MRKILLLGVLLALASPAHAAIAYVRSNNAGAVSAPFTVTLPSNTAGNFMALGLVGNCNIIGASITDSAGNTWTSAIGPKNYSNGQSFQIFYAANIAASAGTNTITITDGSCLGYHEEEVAEYSGVATSSVVDGTGCDSGTSTTTPSCTLTDTSGDLVIGYGVVGSTPNTQSAGAGYTMRTRNFGALEDKVSAGASVTVNMSGTDSFVAILGIAFRPPAAGGAVTGVTMRAKRERLEE